ncbi:GNAT family N-acetyltransferase [Cryptosporangium arvum]|uniref:Acetyltransferase n=1 Tax=Cryptosporangium arvum DSM 44712 TaxID=927661 RepID=A0A010ZXI1_9ACTN|nr:GNAT family N-acetyltransferase [Cryptosporangium arvum]EXG81932.1 acetyltransferase [Cryptosporangium arvum DSM 44712]
MPPSTAPVTVRPAHPDDADTIHRLSLRAIRGSAAGHYTPAELEAWIRTRSAARHRTLIEHTRTLVAECDGAPAGFVSVATEPWDRLERGEVDQLFVDPAFGGRGVARALLAAVDDVATVTHASWRAAPVFERFGYVREETETVPLDGQTLTRVRMRRVR